MLYVRSFIQRTNVPADLVVLPGGGMLSLLEPIAAVY